MSTIHMSPEELEEHRRLVQDRADDHESGRQDSERSDVPVPGAGPEVSEEDSSGSDVREPGAVPEVSEGNPTGSDVRGPGAVPEVGGEDSSGADVRRPAAAPQQDEGQADQSTNGSTGTTGVQAIPPEMTSQSYRDKTIDELIPILVGKAEATSAAIGDNQDAAPIKSSLSDIVDKVKALKDKLFAEGAKFDPSWGDPADALGPIMSFVSKPIAEGLVGKDKLIETNAVLTVVYDQLLNKWDALSSADKSARLELVKKDSFELSSLLEAKVADATTATNGDKKAEGPMRLLVETSAKIGELHNKLFAKDAKFDESWGSVEENLGPIAAFISSPVDAEMAGKAEYEEARKVVSALYTRLFNKWDSLYQEFDKKFPKAEREKAKREKAAREEKLKKQSEIEKKVAEEREANKTPRYKYGELLDDKVKIISDTIASLSDLVKAEKEKKQEKTTSEEVKTVEEAKPDEDSKPKEEPKPEEKPKPEEEAKPKDETKPEGTSGPKTEEEPKPKEEPKPEETSSHKSDSKPESAKSGEKEDDKAKKESVNPDSAITILRQLEKYLQNSAHNLKHDKKVDPDSLKVIDVNVVNYSKAIEGSRQQLSNYVSQLYRLDERGDFVKKQIELLEGLDPMLTEVVSGVSRQFNSNRENNKKRVFGPIIAQYNKLIRDTKDSSDDFTKVRLAMDRLVEAYRNDDGIDMSLQLALRWVQRYSEKKGEGSLVHLTKKGQDRKAWTTETLKLLQNASGTKWDVGRKAAKPLTFAEAGVVDANLEQLAKLCMQAKDIDSGNDIPFMYLKKQMEVLAHNIEVNENVTGAFESVATVALIHQQKTKKSLFTGKKTKLVKSVIEQISNILPDKEKLGINTTANKIEDFEGSAIMAASKKAIEMTFIANKRGATIAKKDKQLAKAKEERDAAVRVAKSEKSKRKALERTRGNKATRAEREEAVEQDVTQNATETVNTQLNPTVDSTQPPTTDAFPPVDQAPRRDQAEEQGNEVPAVGQAPRGDQTDEQGDEVPAVDQADEHTDEHAGEHTGEHTDEHTDDHADDHTSDQTGNHSGEVPEDVPQQLTESESGHDDHPEHSANTDSHEPAELNTSLTDVHAIFRNRDGFSDEENEFANIVIQHNCIDEARSYVTTKEKYTAHLISKDEFTGWLMGVRDAIAKQKNVPTMYDEAIRALRTQGRIPRT